MDTALELIGSTTTTGYRLNPPLLFPVPGQAPNSANGVAIFESMTRITVDFHLNGVTQAKFIYDRGQDLTDEPQIVKDALDQHRNHSKAGK